MSHVFVSYMHDDEPQLRLLFCSLRSAGLDTWIDRDEIVGGSVWKADIRRAIESGAYFLCCFSESRQRRSVTVAHEELLIAIDRLRSMQYGTRWFIPLRVNDCEIPEIPLFGAETLRSLQWIDLFGDSRDGIRRVLQALNVDSKVIDRVCSSRRRSGTKDLANVNASYRRWISTNFAKHSRHTEMIVSSCLRACEAANDERGLAESIQKTELGDTRRVLDVFIASIRSTLEFYSPYMSGEQLASATSALENATLIDQHWRYVTDNNEYFSGDYDEECLAEIRGLVQRTAAALVAIGGQAFTNEADTSEAELPPKEERPRRRKARTPKQ